VENMINIRSGNCNNAYYPMGHMGQPNFALRKVTLGHGHGNLDLENICPSISLIQFHIVFPSTFDASPSR